MKIKSFLTALVMLCFVAAQAQTSAKTPTVDEILANYFKATGGLEKWKALKSRTSTGKAFMGQEFPVEMYEKSPNKVKMIITVQGTQLIPQAYDGQDAWALNPFQGGKDPVKLDEERKAAMVSNLMVVLCGDQNVHPVVNAGTLYSG